MATKQFETKVNTGALFKNKRKEKDTHPDYTGTIKVDEPGEYRVAAWINTARTSGEKYMSLSLTKMDEPETPTKDTPGYSDLDDDVPF